MKRDVYLQEALHVLQQVQTTVAAVVLLRNPTVGAPHVVRREQTGRRPPDLPLHLQVAEHRQDTSRTDVSEHVNMTSLCVETKVKHTL